MAAFPSTRIVPGPWSGIVHVVTMSETIHLDILAGSGDFRIAGAFPMPDRQSPVYVHFRHGDRAIGTAAAQDHLGDILHEIARLRRRRGRRRMPAYDDLDAEAAFAAIMATLYRPNVSPDDLPVERLLERIERTLDLRGDWGAAAFADCRVFVLDEPARTRVLYAPIGNLLQHGPVGEIILPPGGFDAALDGAYARLLDIHNRILVAMGDRAFTGDPSNDFSWLVDVERAAAAAGVPFRRLDLAEGRAWLAAAGDAHRFRGPHLYLDDPDAESISEADHNPGFFARIPGPIRVFCDPLDNEFGPVLEFADAAACAPCLREMPSDYGAGAPDLSWLATVSDYVIMGVGSVVGTMEEINATEALRREAATVELDDIETLLATLVADHAAAHDHGATDPRADQPLHLIREDACNLKLACGDVSANAYQLEPDIRRTRVARFWITPGGRLTCNQKGLAPDWQNTLPRWLPTWIARAKDLHRGVQTQGVPDRDRTHDDFAAIVKTLTREIARYFDQDTALAEGNALAEILHQGPVRPDYLVIRYGTRPSHDGKGGRLCGPHFTIDDADRIVLGARSGWLAVDGDGNTESTTIDPRTWNAGDWLIGAMTASEEAYIRAVDAAAGT